MPDFDVNVTSGVTVEPWLDPAELGLQSRLNARSGLPLKRLVGTVGTQIVMTATVGGVAGPADGALGGRLFTAFLVDKPTPASILQDAGVTSVQWFTPLEPGHYHVRWRRPQGGFWHLHIDVEEAPS